MSEARTGERGASILLVDNDERIVELVAWFLKKRGFAVRTARSFEEARAALAAGPPDLMLSDVDLGAESALDELPRLAADGLLPPTLVVSGYLDATITEALRQEPLVLGFLAKPFDFSVLEERVRDCLRRAPEAAAAFGPARAPGPGAEEPAPGAPGAEAPAGPPAEDEEGWIEITPASRPRASAGPASRPVEFRLR